MARVTEFHLPPFEEDSLFENFCCELWSRIWKDPNTQRHGRSGQRQQGVDVFGRPNRGLTFAGVQAKAYKASLNETDIKKEVERAKTFTPALSELIIATTAPKDAKSEEVVRLITIDHLNQGLFPVTIMSWDDIERLLEDHTDLVNKYFTLPAPAKLLEEQITTIIQKTTTGRQADAFLVQDLRSFTVQIRHTDTDAIVGTGIVISLTGEIVTCAHIVRLAGVELRGSTTQELSVYFPQARGNEAKARRATVIRYFPEHDDDIALLQLVHGPPPLGPEQIAILGSADYSEGNEFRSYGYQCLNSHIAGRADGKILGLVEPPNDRRFHLDPIQLKSGEINAGMSGSAVLDIKQNLVVGLVAETMHPGGMTRDTDTAWAVNAKALTIHPFEFVLRTDPLPKRSVRVPRTEIVRVPLEAVSNFGTLLHGAPPLLSEWVGRTEILKQLTEDWVAADCQVSSLIGFGGEGKSSLARHWLDIMLKDATVPHPDRVIWWDFYKYSIDDFFETAISFLSVEQIDPSRLPSTLVRAQVLGAMLASRRYLFILDGLEVLQYQEGDQYGKFNSSDMREFLTYFAGTFHSSFCLITSRAPIFDLIAFTSHMHRDLVRLSLTDGRNLLATLGVLGEGKVLDRIVEDWDGHALTLTLLGTYLVEKCNGDASKIHTISPPIASENRYERIHRILHCYDHHLSTVERSFLVLFSAFRVAVTGNMLNATFRHYISEDALNSSLVTLDDSEFGYVSKHLDKYRLIRYDQITDVYTIHPLIREFYRQVLMSQPTSQISAFHAHIKDYYLSIASDAHESLTLDILAPLIEAVYHACQAGMFEEAWDIYWIRVEQGNRGILSRSLGAYATAQSLMILFFPSDDLQHEPTVSSLLGRFFILNLIGFCLMNLGILSEAQEFYIRATNVALGEENWNFATISSQNLTALYTYIGKLEMAADIAQEALGFARKASNVQFEHTALLLNAWVLYLCGESDQANALFSRAQEIEEQLDFQQHYLFNLRGVLHIDLLRIAGHFKEARDLTEAELKLADEKKWPHIISQCHRVLGDLAAIEGDNLTADQHYNEALAAARSIAKRDVLIDALLYRGRWLGRLGNTESAASDLNEALEYAVASGYRIYEANARIGLARIYINTGNVINAQAEMQRSKSICEETGYQLGQSEVEIILADMQM